MKMRNIFKSLAAMVFAIAIVLSSVLTGGGALVPKANAENGSANVGDVIEFGSYPQKLVTDKNLISALESEEKSWKSYGYYSGYDGETTGSMTSGDWMQYADFTYDDVKYRAVSFYLYMPDCTYDEASVDYGYSTQKENGYEINEIYYFKYEPIQWIVLDPEEGLVLSKTIIDSQPYSEKLYEGYIDSDECYNDVENTFYANNYSTSSIREWLNDDFYNTAFSDFEKECISTSELENNAFDIAYGRYNSVTTYDNVFLLSFNEANNSAYGFNGSGASLSSGSSDYARCNGLWVNDENGMSPWFLRTAAEFSACACSVGTDGDVDTSDDGMVSSNELGVRPALRVFSIDSLNNAAAGWSSRSVMLTVVLVCIGVVLAAVLVLLFKKTFAK